ncbi:MAG TPA: hypothetical protein VF576_01830 [Rubricoccaceae bacterium]|jgi:hypothetical protein
MRLAALALLVAAGPALAQTAVLPGDPALDTSVIQAGEERFVVRLVAPMQQDIGTIVETTTLADDRVTRVTRIDIPMGGEAQTDSVVAVWPGLAPVSSASTQRGRRAGDSDAVTFMDGHAMTTVTTGGATSDSTITFSEPVFGGGWASEVVRALPLAAGYAATFPTLDAGRGLTTTTATVTGTESVTTPAGPVEAWTVDVANGAQTATYVIAQGTKALLAMRFSPQPGVRIEVAPAP